MSSIPGEMVLKATKHRETLACIPRGKANNKLQITCVELDGLAAWPPGPGSQTCCLPTV